MMKEKANKLAKIALDIEKEYIDQHLAEPEGADVKELFVKCEEAWIEYLKFTGQWET